MTVESWNTNVHLHLEILSIYYLGDNKSARNINPRTIDDKSPVGHVHVNDGGVEHLAVVVRHHGQQPALVLGQAVRGVQHRGHLAPPRPCIHDMYHYLHVLYFVAVQSTDSSVFSSLRLDPEPTRQTFTIHPK